MQEIAEMVFLFRGAERLLVAGGGIFALYIGYRLFVAGIVSHQTGEFSAKSVSVKLLNVGPGVFFALFGTCVLVVVISTTATMNSLSAGAAPALDSDSGAREGIIDFYSGDNVSRLEWMIEEMSIAKTALSSGQVSGQSFVTTLTS